MAKNARRWLLAAGLMLAAGLLAQPALAQKRGGTLVYMIAASGAPGLDAQQHGTFSVIQGVAPFYSTLVQVDPASKGGQKIIGDLATHWDVSKDKKTFTFHLRQNVRFHDGSPLNSRDVLATFKKVLDPPKGMVSEHQRRLYMVDKVTAPDDYTVVFQLKFPTSVFMTALSTPHLFIYDADKLAEDPNWYDSNVLGSGPFKFVEYLPGSHFKGVRNDDYYVKGLPYLDGFEAIYAPKETVQVQAIRGGRAHANFRAFPPAVRDTMVKAMGADATVEESVWNCPMFITFNMDHPPFDKVEVRQALNLALDRWGGKQFLSRTAIVKEVGGFVFPEDPMAPKGDELTSLPGFSHDIEASRAEARELLNKVGLDGKLTVTLLNRNTDQPYKHIGVWVVDQWRKIGVNAKLETVPTAQFYGRLRKRPSGEFDAAFDPSCGPVVDVVGDWSKFLSDSTANYSNHKDPKLDAMYNELLTETDPQKQRKLHLALERLMAEQAYSIGTLWWNRIVVYNSKLKGWNITPSHYLGLNFATVWLEE